MEAVNRYCVTRLAFCDQALIRKGFELAYYDPHDAVNAFEASAKVASFALLDYGLDQVSADSRMLLSITPDWLANANILPSAKVKDRLVLQLPADLPVNESSENTFRQIRAKGFQIALTDYAPNDPREALLNQVDMVIINCQQFILGDIKAIQHQLRRYPVEILASGIESWQAFEKLKVIGFDLYQGSFLAKPELLDTPKNSVNRVLLAKLITLLFDDKSSVSQLETLIEQEPTLFYRLLKFVNSAAYRLPNKIDSLHQAVVYMGTETLRTLVAILVWAKDDHKAYTVLPQILTRAKACELIAKDHGFAPVDRYFTLGFLSLLDVALDQPLPQLITGLSVSDQMQAALLENEGPLAEVLNFVRLWEKANWSALEQHPMFSLERTPELMQQAQHWAAEIEATLHNT